MLFKYLLPGLLALGVAAAAAAAPAQEEEASPARDDRATLLQENLCATLYTEEMMDGDSLEIEDQEQVDLEEEENEELNNEVSSIELEPGCRIKVWTGGNYSGYARWLYHSYSRLGWWNNIISSVYCTCSYY